MASSASHGRVASCWLSAGTSVVVTPGVAWALSRLWRLVSTVRASVRAWPFGAGESRWVTGRWPTPLLGGGQLGSRHSPLARHLTKQTERCHVSCPSAPRPDGTAVGAQKLRGWRRGVSHLRSPRGPPTRASSARRHPPRVIGTAHVCPASWGAARLATEETRLRSKRSASEDVVPDAGGRRLRAPGGPAGTGAGLSGRGWAQGGAGLRAGRG